MSKTKLMVVALFGSILLGIILFGASAQTASTLKWNGNGHYYELVKEGDNRFWKDAYDYAQRQKFIENDTGLVYRGHLAVITSLDEQTWIFDNFLSPIVNKKTIIWLGGFQSEKNEGWPAEGWYWVTGEPWSWTHWDSDEPNDEGTSEDITKDQRYLQMDRNGWWGDYKGADYTDWAKAFLIEYEPSEQINLTALNLTKIISPHSIKNGQNSTVIIKLENTGITTVRDTEVADNPSPDFIISGETAKRFEILKPGESRSFGYTIQSTAAGKFDMGQATALFADEDGNYHTVNSNSPMVEVIEPIIGEISVATREGAIWEVNASSSGGTIQAAVDQAKDGDTIKVASGRYPANVRVDKSVSIVGAGPNETLVDGSNADSVFIVGHNNSNVNVTLSNMTIQGGTGKNTDLEGKVWKCGGGIWNAGMLEVNDCSIAGNNASCGGGIFNEGLLTMTRSSISGNNALEQISDTGHGGGIYNFHPGTLIVDNSTIIGNMAFNLGCGGGIANHGGNVTIINSEITRNKAYYGGGIYNYLGTAQMRRSKLSNNIATEGGAIGWEGNRVDYDSTVIIMDNSIPEINPP